MEIKDAVLRRIYNLVEERKMMLNEVANRAGMTPSTLYSMTSHSQRDVKITTIYKLCNAFNISLQEFFDDEIFTKVE